MVYHKTIMPQLQNGIDHEHSPNDTVSAHILVSNTCATMAITTLSFNIIMHQLQFQCQPLT